MPSSDVRPPDVFLIALTFADGTVGKMSFVTCEYYLHKFEDGTTADMPRWKRLASKENIENEIERLCRVQTSRDGARLCALTPEKLPIKGWRFLTDDEIGLFDEDRDLRNALRDHGNGLEYDMDHAKELFKERIVRPARTPLFMQLDDEERRARGDERKLAIIDERKQELRDAPADPAIEAASTVDELKSVGDWMKHHALREKWNQN